MSNHSTEFHLNELFGKHQEQKEEKALEKNPNPEKTNIWDREAKRLNQSVYYDQEGKAKTDEGEKYALEQFKKVYQEGMKIIEIGCGSGRFLDVIKQAGFNIKPGSYTGFDPSIENITLATEKHEDQNFVTNLDDLENDSFDIALCINVLNHLTNFAEIKETIEFIAKNALFSLLTINYKDEKPHNNVGFTVPIFPKIFPDPKILMGIFEDVKEFIDFGLKAFRGENAKEHKAVITMKREKGSVIPEKAPPEVFKTISMGEVKENLSFADSMKAELNKTSNPDHDPEDEENDHEVDIEDHF